jgi:hypothetical protein
MGIYINTLELKFNQNADAAIDQIRRKQYPDSIAPYVNHLLLVGINYATAIQSSTPVE